MARKQKAIENGRFPQAVAIMSEFQRFMFELSDRLGDTELEPDEDLLKRALALKVKIPEFLQDIDTLTESSSRADHELENLEPLVLVSPGPSSKSLGQSASSEALRIVVKCGHIGRWQVCLECSWIGCKIVIKRSF